VFYQFREAVAGMGEACRALGTPVTGGNVSLYNENPSGAVYPTPVIGMLGVVDSLDHVTRSRFSQNEDAIVLLGEPTDDLGGSEYLACVHGVVAGRPPECDLERERATIEALLEAIRAGIVRSAHDCSEGGFAVALSECAMGDPEQLVGAEVDLTEWKGLQLRALLFGEAQARIIVSTHEPERVIDIASRLGVRAHRVGTVRPGSDSLTITVAGRAFSAPLERLARAYHEAIPRLMTVGVAEPAILEQHSKPAEV
jgi:phosphoribosylformylglycinamidine synthase